MLDLNQQISDKKLNILGILTWQTKILTIKQQIFDKKWTFWAKNPKCLQWFTFFFKILTLKMNKIDFFFDKLLRNRSVKSELNSWISLMASRGSGGHNAFP